MGQAPNPTWEAQTRTLGTSRFKVILEIFWPQQKNAMPIPYKTKMNSRWLKNDREKNKVLKDYGVKYLIWEQGSAQ